MDIEAIPAQPASLISEFGRHLQASVAAEVEAVQDELVAMDERRDAVFKGTRTVFKKIARAMFSLSTGLADGTDVLIADAAGEIEALLGHDKAGRDGNLSLAIETLTEAKLLRYFFVTGRLCPMSECANVTGEEYLAGCLRFAADLSRYVVGRATEGDERSIRICQRLCNNLNSKMLEFDFRNGPLRRRYDGLKYAVRKIEEICYEMSLLEEPALKRLRVADNTDGLLLSAEEFDGIRLQLESYDKLRESVIKDSRDVQKLSKQAIFSVHRNKLDDARKQVQAAVTAAKPIMDLITQHPSLRPGSFSNCLEEFAEAVMTVHWVEQKEILTKAGMLTSFGLAITSHEFIGALSDFTGELGRIAVAAATARELVTVKEIHMTVIVVSAVMVAVNIGGKYNKKAEAVAGTLRKLEDIVYELSMVSKGGRAGRERESEPEVAQEQSCE